MNALFWVDINTTTAVARVSFWDLIEDCGQTIRVRVQGKLGSGLQPAGTSYQTVESRSIA